MEKILINLLSNSMGDTIASVPYVSEYQKKFGGEVYFSTNNFYVNIIKDGYTNLIFVGRNMNFNYDKKIDIDFDFTQNIQLGYAKQLGFENPEYIKPIILNRKTERKIKNKYITISVQSTLQCKYWNHPDGKKVQHIQPYWNQLCGHLRKLGYTPVVVERELTWGTDPFFNGTPNKANKKIGLEFNELMSVIEHSEFFIGLSSGLSWVAHAMGKKVALISNFTEDWNEFDLNDENYVRITNKNVCHGCFNKIKVEHYFNPADWYWCPLHKGTERQFECHKSITPEMVLENIKHWL